MGARIQLKRGTAAFWTSENPILFPGEPGVETRAGRASKFKIGDGITPWIALPYSPVGSSTGTGGSGLDEEAIADLIELAVANHIASGSPHPVYDDGPSLSLLYENAKV